jgi:succinoglycan biosynthesis protein ExoA
LYVAVLGATSLGLAIKHRSPCGLLAGPAAATMHAAWALGFLLGLATLREEPWHAGMAHGLDAPGAAS